MKYSACPTLARSPARPTPKLSVPLPTPFFLLCALMSVLLPTFCRVVVGLQAPESIISRLIPKLSCQASKFLARVHVEAPRRGGNHGCLACAVILFSRFEAARNADFLIFSSQALAIRSSPRCSTLRMCEILEVPHEGSR